MEVLLALAALSIPLAMNLWATRLILRDETIAGGQRGAQLALVWLLPFVGAIMAIGVRRKEEPPSRKYRTENDPGDDFALSGKTVPRSAEALDGD